MKKLFRSKKSEGLPNGPNYINTTSEGFIITSNGQFGKGESRWFKTASSLSVENINGLTELAVYPNPANVRLGVQYGPTGNDYTGTFVSGQSLIITICE